MFQKITEAAHEVLEFLTAKGKNQPESIEKTDVLSRFVRTNKVVYNKKCVTFYLTKYTVEVWKKEFEKMLWKPKPLPSHKSNKEPGIQYKQDTWSVSCVSEKTFGKISVNIYHSTLKVMLQGATYLDFITLAITNMVERLGLLYDVDEIPASVDELEDFVDAEENVTPVINEDDGNFLVVGFKRMENAVVTLREDLLRKVDESLLNDDKKEQPTLDDISQ